MTATENPKSFIIKILIILSVFLFFTSFPAFPQETGGREKEQAQDTSKSLVEDVKDYSKKEGFFPRLIRNILVNDDELVEKSRRDADRSNARYAGRIIRNITIRTLDVFGTSVDRPEDTVHNWLIDAGNSIHTNTRSWLIKNKLLFYEGIRLSPFDLTESERILRQNPYIYDVSIIARPVKGKRNSVDITVYVQDVWSITGGASYNPSDKSGSLSFRDINFLGLANELNGGIKFGSQFQRGWDWEGGYTFNNIDRTFLTAGLYYRTDSDQRAFGISVFRDFFSPVISWAGGISLDFKKNRQLFRRDTLFFADDVAFSQSDYWFGYAFDVKPFNPYTVNQNRFNIAVRATRTKYSSRPDFDTLNIFQNSTLYIGRLGYSLRSYYQDRYIFGLGKTEDVPTGTMLEMLYGIEDGQFTDRPYLGFRAAHSFWKDGLGYLYGAISAGAFKQGEQWINGTSVIEMIYFSKLLKAGGDWHWRHFIGSKYSQSFASVSGFELLDLNNEHGLRGFTDPYLRGNRKLTLNYETNFFMPLQFLGFRLALITFADFALLAPQKKHITDSRLFQGYGIGFRIRNEHLIFPQFQLMLAYYPGSVLPGGERLNIFKQTSMFYKLNQFQFSKPDVVLF